MKLASIINMRLKVITPRKLVLDKDVIAVTAPALEGEITILPRHTNLFSLLKEGIVKIKETGNNEEYLAIGGGYLETDGMTVQIIVSRAYNQDEIDRELTEKAIESAKNILASAKDENQKREATMLLRRSLIDLKLLRKRRSKPTVG